MDKVGRFCRPIKSSDFVVQLEHVVLSMIKSANFLNIGHHGDCLQWEMNIYFSYSFCLLFYNVYFRLLDAEKNNASIILRSAFCCCVFVISYEVADDKIGCVSWFNDFIRRFSRATKPFPRKLANFAATYVFDQGQGRILAV